MPARRPQGGRQDAAVRQNRFAAVRQNRFLFTLRIVRAILYKEFLCLGEIF